MEKKRTPTEEANPGTRRGHPKHSRKDVEKQTAVWLGGGATQNSAPRAGTSLYLIGRHAPRFARAAAVIVRLVPNKLHLDGDLVPDSCFLGLAHKHPPAQNAKYWKRIPSPTKPPHCYSCS